MLIVCPRCKTRFRFDEQQAEADGIRLRCGRCGAVFRVVRKNRFTESGDGPNLSGQHPLIRVVVANESVTFCNTVKDVLARESFEVYAFHDGRDAFDAIARIKPDVVLLDVALPSMYGFEVCDAIRKEPEISATKVILIASIYDKTKYKRAPVSLYGADDYIEKHHIPDSLAAMINRLVPEQKPLESPAGTVAESEEEALLAPQEFSNGEMKEQEITRQALQKNEESETSPPAPGIDTELSDIHVKARRLARIIVSDIALYNQARVEEGVRNDSFYRLLADEIAEGRSIYLSRFPVDLIKENTFLEDAFEELIAIKKEELGL